MLAAVYHRIALDSISLDIDGHLVKIDASRAEYLLFNLILTFYAELICVQIRGFKEIWTKGFMANQLFDLVQTLPAAIWPDYRKKQAYLSSLLSRNEINSKYTPNRKLFTRIARGCYMINPDLKIKTSSGWELPKPYALPLNLSESTTAYEEEMAAWMSMHTSLAGDYSTLNATPS